MLSDQCHSKMLALSCISPKLKASTENYDVTWCDIITQRIYLGSRRINHEDVDSRKPPSCNRVIDRCRRLTVSQRFHTSAGTSTSTLIHHPMQWDASGRFESVGYWLIIVDGHVDPLWGWAWGWRRWQRKMKVILLIIYAKEFIFAWLKVKISWWSTLPIYLQLITYYTWWYNVQDPTYPLSNTAKHPNTQQPNKPKKHEETRHRSVKKIGAQLRHVRPSCCLHPKRRLFRCSDLWYLRGRGASWVEVGSPADVFSFELRARFMCAYNIYIYLFIYLFIYKKTNAFMYE